MMKDDVQNAIRVAKSGKAVIPDGICTEILKLIDKDVAESLT